MPQDLVARINASLAAEQATRAATPSETVTPLVRRRGRRVALAAAGAAAAVAAVAALGTAGLGLLQRGHDGTATSAAAQLATRAASGATKAQGSAGLRAPARTPMMQLHLSGTHYTATDFATQAGALPRPSSTLLTAPAGSGAVATPQGLLGCVTALGEGDADAVLADLGYYEGRPAAVILAWHGTSTTAYAVRRDCSRGRLSVLHAATSVQ